MRVDYINSEQCDSYARVTFIGYDPSTSKRRRPMVELSANDLASLIRIARDFRQHQKRLAQMHSVRGDAITQSGVAL
jgi:hypothetical protein